MLTKSQELFLSYANNEYATILPVARDTCMLGKYNGSVIVCVDLILIKMQRILTLLHSSFIMDWCVSTFK